MSRLLSETKDLIKNKPYLIRGCSKEIFHEFLQNNLLSEDFVIRAGLTGIPNEVKNILNKPNGITLRMKKHVSAEADNIEAELNRLRSKF